MCIDSFKLAMAGSQTGQPYIQPSLYFEIWYGIIGTLVGLRSSWIFVISMSSAPAQRERAFGFSF